MSIRYLPQHGFPFGNNIHFAYCVSSAQFLFVHSSISWIFSDTEANDPAVVISKIDEQDIPYLQDVFNKVLSGSFNGKITLKLLSPKGTRSLLIIPYIGNLEGKQLVTGSVADVSDEVANIESLTKYTDKKNSILHMLGHDLRGPLNIAKSLIKTVAKQVEEPVLLERTEHIAIILEQSIEMISDLLKREFLETASAELVRKRVDIVKLLKDYLEECKRSENIAGINFQLSSTSDRILIDLDNAKFMQVVNNLISNSLKFSPAGGTISITVEEQQDHVNFKFTDEGVGIPESLLPKIFDKFTAARRPGLHGEPTLGLGLSIVRSIINWHEGTISCESIEGKGTTFLIRIPKQLTVFNTDNYRINP